MSGRRLAFITTTTLILIVSYVFLSLPSPLDLFKVSYNAVSYPADQLSAAVGSEAEALVVTHIPTPEPLKAIYMTSCVAGTPYWRESLKKLIEDTELNAVVIDIKDYTGRVSFPNTFPKSAAQRGCTVSDLPLFITALHEKGIYVIGRISVFQDVSYSNLFPELAVKSLNSGGVWKDNKGLSFIDVGAKSYWDYIIDISNQAYAIGFDELNYDYVRYPSDGIMSDANFTWTTGTSTRAMMLQNFFAHLHDKLKDTGVKTSVDLFGMTTTALNDMGIGQVLELALPYFDYVAPMVYPSHYPRAWQGLSNPAEHPYEVIKIALSEGKRREEALRLRSGQATSTPSKLRPWLQDFSLGAAYGPDKVQAQIQAVYDTGLDSWMLWSAGNIYTEAALLVEETKNLQAQE